MAAVFAYDNLLRGAAILSEETLVNFGAVKGADGRASSQVGFASGADRSVVYDFSIVKSFDTFCLANHNFGTSGASMKVEGSADNVGYSVIDTIAIANNNVKLHTLPSSSFRYVRLTIQGHGGAAYASDIYIGPSLLLPYGMPKGFVSPEEYDQDVISSNITGNGSLVGIDVEEKPKRCKIPIKDVERSWFDSYWLALVAAVKQYPAYFLWSEGERAMYFYFYRKAPAPKFTTNNRKSVTLDVEGVV